MNRTMKKCLCNRFETHPKTEIALFSSLSAEMLMTGQLCRYVFYYLYIVLVKHHVELKSKLRGAEHME